MSSKKFYRKIHFVMLFGDVVFFIDVASHRKWKQRRVDDAVKKTEGKEISVEF